MATNKTVRVVTGVHPPNYRSCAIVASATGNTFPTYLQTTLNDRTFETIHDAGAPPVAGLKTVIVTGYSRGGSAPTVSSVTPSAGPQAGGTSVVIAGTGFTSATAVKFGATNAASFVVNSDIQITAVSPAGSAGVQDVTVTNPSGTSSTSAADQFTYSSFQGPGDIASGAIAWWGLRAYSNAMVGTRAIRVQRSSDSTQKDIATLPLTGMLNTSDAFFDGSTTYTLLKFYDQSGAKFGTGSTSLDTDSIQVAGAVLLLNYASTGLPAIQVNGGSIYTTNTTGSSLTPPFSVSGVGRRDTGGGASILTSVNSAATVDFFWTAAANQIAVFNGSTAVALSVADNTRHAMQGLFSSSVSGSELYVDGVATTGLNAGTTTTASGNTMGFPSALVGDALTGYVWEAGWWTGDQSSNFSAINLNQRGSANGWNF